MELNATRKNFIKDKWMIPFGSLMNAYGQVYQGSQQDFSHFVANVNELMRIAQVALKNIDAEIEDGQKPYSPDDLGEIRTANAILRDGS